MMKMMIDEKLICPKCNNKLFETDVLRGCDITEPALACTNGQCDFFVSDTLGEFLYDDCWD